MTLSEKYEIDQLTDNTKIEYCKQCKDCILQGDGTPYSNYYQKGSCVIYAYSKFKPMEIIHNKTDCEYREVFNDKDKNNSNNITE